MKCIISYRVQALKKIKEQEISIGSGYVCVCFFCEGEQGRGNFWYSGQGKCINQNWQCYVIVINLDISGLTQQNFSFLHKKSDVDGSLLHSAIQDSRFPPCCDGATLIYSF